MMDGWEVWKPALLLQDKAALQCNLHCRVPLRVGAEATIHENLPEITHLWLLPLPVLLPWPDPLPASHSSTSILCFLHTNPHLMLCFWGLGPRYGVLSGKFQALYFILLFFSVCIISKDCLSFLFLNIRTILLLHMKMNDKSLKVSNRVSAKSFHA